jgi:hypothetical protein
VVVQYFNSKSKQCPNQKYVIVGYSQGCVVQRRAMVKLDAPVLEKIIAVVTFGDPGECLHDGVRGLTSNQFFRYEERNGTDGWSSAEMASSIRESLPHKLC